MTISSTIFVIGALIAYLWSLRVMRMRNLGESDFKENALFGVFIVLWLAAMVVVALNTWVW